MRAMYQIMAQPKGGELRVVFTSTRKREIEQRFNRMRREYQKIKSVSIFSVIEGYFVECLVSGFSIIETEYWIFKA